MSKESEYKKDKIEEVLSKIFVDKYDFFSDTLKKINTLFKKYNIEYEYKYNDFCVDYINRCKFYIDENPELDLDNIYLYAIITSDVVKNKMDEFNIDYGQN